MQSPIPYVQIPDDIVAQLMDEGFIIPRISDKEWRVQKALGTAPTCRLYAIQEEAA